MNKSMNQVPESVCLCQGNDINIDKKAGNWLNEIYVNFTLFFGLIKLTLLG